MGVFQTYRPDPQQALLLVIDIQERLFGAMPPKAQAGVLRGAGLLLQAAVEFEMPLVLLEQYPKGLGQTIPALRELIGEGYSPLEKLEFNALELPAFKEKLENSGRRDVILCGMEAHICVLQTALALLDAGYRVFVAADAVSSRNKPDWKLGLDIMRQAGAVVGSSEMFLFMFCNKAGSEQFKRVSKMVR